MKNKLVITSSVLKISMFIIILMLLAASKGFMTKDDLSGKVNYISTASASIDGGPSEVITLPYSFKHLKPRTPVVLTVQITPQKGDVAFIKSVYSPARIYENNKLIYEFGIVENYPKFMLDPATEVHLVNLEGNEKRTTLCMAFLSPVSRNTLTVSPLIIGSSKVVLFELEHRLGLSFDFAIMQMIIGISLIFISIYIVLFDRKGMLFFWLGLLSLLTGMWTFGENNFTGLLIKNPTFLYLLAFIGFFTFTLPLIQFTNCSIDFENPKPLFMLEIFVALSIITALMLQFMGIVPCSKSMYYFHILQPLVLILLSVLTIHEYIRYKNPGAKRLMVSLTLLAVFSILELFNYKFRLVDVLSSIFQLGIFLFLLSTGITAGLYLKDSVDLKNKQKELNFEKHLLDMQINEQKSRSLLLSNHEQELSRQRHDLRHHLAVLMDLSTSDSKKLQDYLTTLIGSIPAAKKSYCENLAVNAIVSHYYTLCTTHGISFSCKLIVPKENTQITDSSLCVVFGNLLENAVEACDRMTEGHRFIKLNSSLQYELLTITMDNSFDGQATVINDRFLSRKCNAFGIGLTSIQEIARRCQGDSSFEYDGLVFYSSVYVRI